MVGGSYFLVLVSKIVFIVNDSPFFFFFLITFICCLYLTCRHRGSKPSGSDLLVFVNVSNSPIAFWVHLDSRLWVFRIFSISYLSLIFTAIIIIILLLLLLFFIFIFIFLFSTERTNIKKTTSFHTRQSQGSVGLSIVWQQFGRERVRSKEARQSNIGFLSI